MGIHKAIDIQVSACFKKQLLTDTIEHTNQAVIFVLCITKCIFKEKDSFGSFKM